MSRTKDAVVAAFTGTPKRRCRAHNRDGSPCKNAPCNGTSVCRMHGGSAPQVRRKAAERIRAAADPAAAKLVELMQDAGVPYAVQLAAAKDLLDRAGLSAKTVVEVQSEAPWLTLLQKIVVDVDDEAPVRQPAAEASARTVPGEAIPAAQDDSQHTQTVRVSVDDTPPARLDPDGLSRRRGTRMAR